ncbi:MAG: VWA domain-containing protein [Acidobacteria bacterium]|nr:VWA domain-containing protein [Acidobacteriota bacterium]
MLEVNVVRMNSVFKPKRLVVAVCIFLALGAKSLYAQGEVIRVETNLITVPAVVTDRQGRNQADLKVEDFEIFEDGKKQEIAYFSSSDQPITVFLLMDVSDSVRAEITEIARAATAFIGKLQGTDSIMAAQFSWRTEMVIPKTKVADLKGRLTLRISEGDPETLIYDAVKFAQRRMDGIQGKSAIIVLSDAMGSGLSASYKSTIKDAQEQEPVFYTMHFGVSRERPFADPKKFAKYRDTSISYMKTLAEMTGGRYYQFDSVNDIDGTFNEILTDLRRQYQLGYYSDSPGKNGEKRKITVKVNRPDVAVRSRNEVVYKKGNK